MAISEGTEVQHYAHCSSSKQEANRLKDFRPLLCNTVYKLLSKILATIGLSRSHRGTKETLPTTIHSTIH